MEFIAALKANRGSKMERTVGPAVKSAMLLLIAAFALSGCSRMASGPTFPSNPFAPEPVETPAPTVSTSPVARLEQQASGLGVSGYVAPSALSSMTEKDKSEAASAQFFALQFGRPGAPRNWSGDTGNSGEVTVGPFIRVNNLDCREFTHKVTVSGTGYTQDGTSCRESTGDWRVAAIG